MQIKNENEHLKLSSDNTVLKLVGGQAIKGEKGDVGPQGPTGPVGPQGPKGDKGDSGERGKDGINGINGKDGQDGRGIKSITVINTKDKVKTYRIEYTDGTSFDFQIKDGEDGKDGKGMSGGAILKGAEKTSRKSQYYTDNSKETYPSSYALSSAVTQLRHEMEEVTIQLRRVDELPEEGEPYILYLVPVNDPETSNIYDEYIWAIQGDETYAFEKLGTTEIDLSGYLTTDDIVSSVDSSSTNLKAVGAKLFYDTCGDIEAAINIIRGV